MKANIELYDSVQSALDAIFQNTIETEIIYAQNVASGEDLVEQSSENKEAIHKFVDMEVECPPKDEAECSQHLHAKVTTLTSLSSLVQRTQKPCIVLIIS
jgi:hypothetical protein